MRTAHLLVLLGLVVASQLSSAQQPAPGQANTGSMPQATATSPQAPVGPLQQRNPRYELRPGDIVEVGFTFSPEFNQVVPVQPDGFITLRDVSDLHAAGMSLPELRDAIAKAYSNVLNKPEVTVTLKDFEKPYFIATGQVTRPGKYELRGPTRVTEAIAIAGGFTDAAKHSQVVLFRRVSRDWMEAKLVDIKKMLAQKDLNEDMFVSAGDVVYVPQSRYSHFRRFIPAPGLGMSINPVP